MRYNYTYLLILIWLKIFHGTNVFVLWEGEGGGVRYRLNVWLRSAVLRVLLEAKSISAVNLSATAAATLL